MSLHTEMNALQSVASRGQSSITCKATSPPPLQSVLAVCGCVRCVCVVMLMELLCMLSVSVAAVSSSPVPSSSSHKGHQSPTGPTHRGRWGASPYERHVLVSRTPSEQHGLVPVTEREGGERYNPDVLRYCQSCGSYMYSGGAVVGFGGG